MPPKMVTSSLTQKPAPVWTVLIVSGFFPQNTQVSSKGMNSAYRASTTAAASNLSNMWKLLLHNYSAPHSLPNPG